MYAIFSYLCDAKLRLNTKLKIQSKVMEFLTNEKLTIVGAAGMIGSNMAQTAAILRLTPNICLYDVSEPGLEGVTEEMRHSGFDGVNFTYTTDVKEAFKDAKYIISSGGAPRKAGMTREDLLKGNAGVAEELGKNIKQYCPDVKHVVVIFNPADITGLITLIWSGLRPSQVTTLAALDSIRLQSELAKFFKVNQCEVTGCHTYGGHGEAMAVFASGAKVKGTPLTELIGTDKLTNEQWDEIKHKTVQGGSNIIKLRGRSSFQSPAYVAVKMIEGAMGGEPFTWPAGRYSNLSGLEHVMMALDTRITVDGAYYEEPLGSDEERAALKKSYDHLVTMRQEVIDLGVLPPVEKWSELNPNLH